MDRALILGHSFVRTLQDIDFNLGQVFNVVKLGFKSGATLRDINVRDCLSYQVIVLVIGSNDLCNKDTHPRELAIDIIDRALEIVDLNLEHKEICKVVISQILERGQSYVPRQNQRELLEYNEAMAECNSAIKQSISGLFGIHFYTTTDFSNIERYLLDGVHLNTAGRPIFTRYIRGTLLFGHNQLHDTQALKKRKKHRAGGGRNQKS